MAKQDDYIRYTIRVPADLYEKVSQAAAENGRSVNAEIVARLETSLADKRVEDVEGWAGLIAAEATRRVSNEYAKIINEGGLPAPSNEAETPNKTIDEPREERILELFRKMDNRYQAILDEVKAINDRYEADLKSRYSTKLTSGHNALNPGPRALDIDLDPTPAPRTAPVGTAPGLDPNSASAPAPKYPSQAIGIGPPNPKKT